MLLLIISTILSLIFSPYSFALEEPVCTTEANGIKICKISDQYTKSLRNSQEVNLRVHCSVAPASLPGIVPPRHPIFIPFLEIKEVYGSEQNIIELSEESCFDIEDSIERKQVFSYYTCSITPLISLGRIDKTPVSFTAGVHQNNISFDEKGKPRLYKKKIFTLTKSSSINASAGTKEDPDLERQLTDSCNAVLVYLENQKQN